MVVCTPFLLLFLVTSVLSLIFKALLLLSLRHLKTFPSWVAKMVHSPLVQKGKLPPTCFVAREDVYKAVGASPEKGQLNIE